MNEFGPLFDMVLAVEARDLGMAIAAQDVAHATVIDQAMRYAALSHPEVTADVVRQYLNREPGPAMGPAFNRAQKVGLIEPTAVFRKSSNVNNHAHHYRVWRSLVYRGAA